MSRSGYNDDYSDDDPAMFAMYRGMVASATRGKRGQALLKDILIAMNGMTVKRLIKAAEAVRSFCNTLPIYGR